MSRPTTRRAAVVATAAAVLASAAVPALAASFPVSISTTGGTRQFSVKDATGAADLVKLDFGTSRSMKYKVVVADQGVPLLGNDYTVSTTLSNLYFQKPDGTTDYATKIPSSSLALDYDSANPLAATGLQLPVVPDFTVSGLLSCDGLTVPALGTLATVCGLISGLTGPVTAPVTGPAQVLDDVDLTAALSTLNLGLPALPLSMQGAQQRGRFMVPAKAGANDPESGVGATSLTIMGGKNLLTGSTLSDALAVVNEGLKAALAGADIIPNAGGTSVLSTSAVLDALSTQSPVLGTLTGLIRTLTPGQQLEILNGLNATLKPVVDPVGKLAGLTGTYSATPVLRAEPATTKPGTYNGTMTVDFFQP